MGRWSEDEIGRTFRRYEKVVDQMQHFPTQWYIIDEERGWVVCEFMNRMADPGDGSVHQAKNDTRLEYAGDDVWWFQEDQYNPAAFASMIERWMKARGD